MAKMITYNVRTCCWVARGIGTYGSYERAVEALREHDERMIEQKKAKVLERASKQAEQKKERLMKRIEQAEEYTSVCFKMSVALKAKVFEAALTSGKGFGEYMNMVIEKGMNDYGNLETDS